MKNRLFLACAILHITCISADVATGVLEKYRNRIFINTGIGASVNFCRAIERSSFPEIYLVEEKKLLVDHFNAVKARKIEFFRPGNLQKHAIFHADSSIELADIIAQFNVPITFLLSTCVPEYREFDKGNCVLLELEQIGNYPVKNHTIMIDYIHHAGTPSFGNVSLEAIKAKLLSINPHYRFTFEKGGHLEQEDNAILVAYVSR